MVNETIHHHELMFFQRAGSIILSGLFTWIGVIITCQQIACHLKHYTNGDQQKYIVRILLIVPIYCLDSWLSLMFYQKNYYIYFNTVRDCYEAFVIYNFMCLCYEYLGGEMAILSEVRGKPIKTSYFSCTCCLSGQVLNIEFLRSCKKAALQFCLIKPVMAALILVLVATDNYTDGDFSLDHSYLYITIIYNISYTLALYGLLLFYTATKDLLSPFFPVLKFLTVKFVIFMSFWQGLVLAFLERRGLIGYGDESVKVAAGYQNFILCIEMFFAAILMRFAFPYTVYRIQGHHRMSSQAALKTMSTNFRKSINPKDIVQDTIHNFSPAYQHYAGVHKAIDTEISLGEDGREGVSYQVTVPDQNHDTNDKIDRHHDVKEQPNRRHLSVESANGNTPLLLDTDDV